MGKVLENHMDVIFDVTTKDGNSAALSQTKGLLKAMNCAMLEEVEAKVRNTLKSHDVRVKPLLILIKSLYAGD